MLIILHLHISFPTAIYSSAHIEFTVSWPNNKCICSTLHLNIIPLAIYASASAHIESAMSRATLQLHIFSLTIYSSASAHSESAVSQATLHLHIFPLAIYPSASAHCESAVSQARLTTFPQPTKAASKIYYSLMSLSPSFTIWKKGKNTSFPPLFLFVYLWVCLPVCVSCL